MTKEGIQRRKLRRWLIYSWNHDIRWFGVPIEFVLDLAKRYYWARSKSSLEFWLDTHKPWEDYCISLNYGNSILFGESE